MSKNEALIAMKMAITRRVCVVKKGGSGGYKRGSRWGKRLLMYWASCERAGVKKSCSILISSEKKEKKEQGAGHLVAARYNTH